MIPMHELIADPSLHTRCGIELSELDPRTNTARTSDHVIKVNLTGNAKVTCAACLEKENLMIAPIDTDTGKHHPNCTCSTCKCEQTRERYMPPRDKSWACRPDKHFPGGGVMDHYPTKDITRDLRLILLDELHEWGGVTLCPAPRGEIRLTTRRGGIDYYTTITLETKT